MKNNWKVSLHGGHSGEFCEHATGKLRDILEAAVGVGFYTFGVSEHVPRFEERFLYESEKKKGYTVDNLAKNFDSYGNTIHKLAEEFKGRLVVLKGFEIEVIPTKNYVEVMNGFKTKYNFDYMVGSVHYVDEIIIDGNPPEYVEAIEKVGSLEKLVIKYYEAVAKMVSVLKPDVTAHFDIIRKNAKEIGSVDTPKIRKVAEEALQVVKEHDSILDLNTKGYRRGFDFPYPAPWIVELAKKMGINFCFGDDSHSVDEVGAGLDDAKKYLLTHGINKIQILTKKDGSIIKVNQSLID